MSIIPGSKLTVVMWSGEGVGGRLLAGTMMIWEILVGVLAVIGVLVLRAELGYNKT
jgi:hypothetical protein